MKAESYQAEVTDEETVFQVGRGRGRTTEQYPRSDGGDGRGNCIPSQSGGVRRCNSIRSQRLSDDGAVSEFRRCWTTEQYPKSDVVGRRNRIRSQTLSDDGNVSEVRRCRTTELYPKSDVVRRRNGIRSQTRVTDGRQIMLLMQNRLLKSFA